MFGKIKKLDNKQLIKSLRDKKKLMKKIQVFTFNLILYQVKKYIYFKENFVEREANKFDED